MELTAAFVTKMLYEMMLKAIMNRIAFPFDHDYEHAKESRSSVEKGRLYHFNY